MTLKRSLSFFGMDCIICKWKITREERPGHLAYACKLCTCICVLGNKSSRA